VDVQLLHHKMLFPQLKGICRICSVSNPDSLIPDPDSLIPDPDPAFLAEYQSGSRVLMTKTFEKFTAEKINYFLYQPFQFTGTYPSASIKDLQATIISSF
jgi:hypothetical protein